MGNLSILAALKEISRSVELESGVMYVAAAKEPGKKLKIKFVLRTALEKAKKAPDNIKDE